jgi:pilus assembly protein Flp/PilA
MSARSFAAGKVRRSAVEPAWSAFRLARRHALRFHADESGATAIEYGLIASLIVIVIITALQSFGTVLTAMWDYIATTITAKMG